MAISRDVAGGGLYDNAGSITQLSWDHTIGSGNPFLSVFFVAFRPSATACPTVTDVSFNSVSLTRIDALAVNSGGQTYQTELWYLAAPPTGTHSVVMNLSGNVSGGEMYGNSHSYLGVDQVSPIDSHSAISDMTATQSGSTATTTVVAANCWLVGLGTLLNGIGNGVTFLSNQFDVEPAQMLSQYFDFADSNAIIGTGSQSIIWTKSNAPVVGYFSFIGAFSLKPAVGVVIPDFILMSQICL